MPDFPRLNVGPRREKLHLKQHHYLVQVLADSHNADPSTQVPGARRNAPCDAAHGPRNANRDDVTHWFPRRHIGPGNGRMIFPIPRVQLKIAPTQKPTFAAIPDTRLPRYKVLQLSN